MTLAAYIFIPCVMMTHMILPGRSVSYARK